MRPLLLVLALLAAGCASPTPDEEAPGGNVTAPPTAPAAGEEEAAPAPPVGERMQAAMEHFVLLGNRSISVHAPDAPYPPEEKVPEPVSGAPLVTGQATGLPFAPFVSFPFRVPFETTAEFDVVMRFTSSAHAVATIPPGGFPVVGGWFGTPERYALFIGASDAPATLEPDRVYSVTMRVPLPPGGFFVRAGEPIAITPYASYQVADGSPLSWVVGGADAAGFALPHAHFNVTAPRAVVLLDESGETGPNPHPFAAENKQPAVIPFQVPPEAVYVVLEVTGAPKAGTTIDTDASIRTPAGDVLAAGSGPSATEVAVIGPGALAAAGRDLVAHVSSGSSASGGTFQLKVTAYVP